MDSVGQLRCFLLAVGVGFAGGIFYETISFLRLLFGCRQGKNKAVAVVLDILFWIVFACFCVFAENLFKFKGFRIYIWSGYALGGIIYFIFLHRIVAFFENVCYNKATKLVKKAKNREKTPKQR